MPDNAQAAYDAVAEAYSRALDADGAGLSDPVLDELIGDIAGRDVLDLACGQGQAARMLARASATVTGVDISKEMLTHARRHETEHPRNISYIHDDAQQLSTLADQSFDGVVCHMALMDIPDLAATTDSVARVLRDGGWFVFSIVHPCYRNHVEVIDDYLIDHAYRKRIPRDWLPVHAYHRPLSTVVNALADAKFRLERMIEVHHSPNDGSGVPGLLYARSVKA